MCCWPQRSDDWTFVWLISDIHFIRWITKSICIILSYAQWISHLVRVYNINWIEYKCDFKIRFILIHYVILHLHNEFLADTQSFQRVLLYKTFLFVWVNIYLFFAKPKRICQNSKLEAHINFIFVSVKRFSISIFRYIMWWSLLWKLFRGRAYHKINE